MLFFYSSGVFFDPTTFSTRPMAMLGKLVVAFLLLKILAHSTVHAASIPVDQVLEEGKPTSGESI